MEILMKHYKSRCRLLNMYVYCDKVLRGNNALCMTDCKKRYHEMLFKLEIKHKARNN